MANPEVSLLLLGDYAKGIPSPLISFSFFFFFFLGEEGLSALIRKSVELGTIKGIDACARGPSISRLFFANDSMIFCKATGEECSNLIGILEKYEKALGQ